jgi:hypothetical protein
MPVVEWVSGFVERLLGVWGHRVDCMEVQPDSAGVAGVDAADDVEDDVDDGWRVEPHYSIEAVVVGRSVAAQTVGAEMCCER